MAEAKSIVLRYEEVLPQPTDGTTNFIVWAKYIGSDWPDGYEIFGSLINVDVLSDTINQINDKITTEIRAHATQRGATIPTNGIIFPSFTKG